ncbi:diguanylate cyclase [Desulfuromonas thiophila]|uniref:diguanylate cyclase n=1 Tax=Desulfuromonas thiophila TaxID=57664 RepID=A0A1G7A484_9BACT|nr:transporter substrate-binding domain-containing protein [Desulfuromonas thiophila]SDE09704.1 polar amino acid transport system substrate-binding protein [Desulfuromonas thiophila]
MAAIPLFCIESTASRRRLPLFWWGLLLVGLLVRLLSLPAVAHAQPSSPDPLGLTAAERGFLQQNRLFEVHVEPDYMPFAYVENGQAKGFVVDLADLLAERLGIRFVYRTDHTWDQALEALRNRRIDLVLAMVDTPERRDYARFTTAVLNTYVGLATRRDDRRPKQLEDFAGRRLAVVAGYWHEAVLRTHYPRIELVRYPDHLRGLEALAAGTVDGLLSTDPVLTFHIRRHYLLNLESRPLVGDWFKTTREGIGVRRDYPLLVSALQKALDRIDETELNALRRRWLIDNGGANEGGLQLTLAQRRYLEELGEIRVAIAPDWMPLEGRDARGQHTGFSADYLALLQQLLQVPLRLLDTPSWADSVQALRDGRADLLPLAADTPSRRDALIFTRPYLDLPVVVATRDDALFIENAHQLVGRRLGAVRGYAVTELFRQRYPAIELVELASLAEGIDKVHRGELFGLVDTVAALGQAIARQGYKDVRISGQLDLQLHLGIGVRKDAPALRDILDRAVAELGPREGPRLYNKWVAVSYRSGVRPVVVLCTALVGVLVTGVFVYRNRRLRQLNLQLVQAHLLLEEKSRELERLSVTDRLTGLYNRLKIEETFDYEWRREKRYQQPLSLILLDLDHFKRVNDTYGHQQGDRVLCAVAAVLRGRARESDLVGRWGGEEYMIICPGTSLDEARFLALSLCRAIAGLDLAPLPPQTASFGVATVHPGDEQGEVFRRADRALYRAKEHGRNCVVAEYE